MPLSEHEQHQLEQMEQALYAEDPKFASQMQGSAVRALLRRRLFIAAVAVIGGLGLVVLGVAQAAVLWGAIGFALMVSGVAYAITPAKAPKAGLGAVAPDGSVRAHEPAARSRKPRQSGRRRQGAPGSGSSKQSFMRRVEERWNRRRGD
ncbi:MAG: DUF3040 domain-containing protein [Dermatophilaceae bacterium]